MERRVSDELMQLLSRQGMRGATVGAVGPSGVEKAGGKSKAGPRVAPKSVSPGDVMSWANDVIDREEMAEDAHSPSGGEEKRPNRLPRLRIVRAMPFLAVIDCVER